MARYMYVRDIITEDQTWTAPEAKDQEFEVSVWGGGGAGSIATFEEPVTGAGGGSGYMKSGKFTIPSGETVDIKIGQGGKGCIGTTASAFVNAYIGKSGGSTTFGRYLSAGGGQGGNYDQGGIGGYNGGAPGTDGIGNFGSYGIMNTCNNVFFASGGGGSGVMAKGMGGSANYAAGDAGTSGGGAGAFITSVDNFGIHRKTGSGGRGVCVIKYNRKLGD